MKKHWLAVLVLFLIAGAWGVSFTIVKSVLTRIPPEPFIVLRFTIAGVRSSISQRRFTVGTESLPTRLRSTTGLTLA